jgi:hypothetical protein
VDGARHRGREAPCLDGGCWIGGFVLQEHALEPERLAEPPRAEQGSPPFAERDGGVGIDERQDFAIPPHRRFAPGEWKYFVRWRTSRWFLLLLIPVAQSAVAAIWRGRDNVGLAVALFGTAVAAWLFLTLMTGVSSTNAGTLVRMHTPERYWAEISLVGALYLGLSVAGWLLT